MTPVIDRIQKLLALAEGHGTNPNEAAVAAARAAALMERHRLVRAEIEGALEGDIRVDDEELADGETQITSWKSVLAQKLAFVEGCRAIEQLWLSPDGRTTRARLLLVGRPEAVAVARYLYRYLEREIERLYLEARRRRVVRGRTAAINFRLGAVKAIHARLEKSKAGARGEHVAEGGTTAALARLDGEGLEVERWLRSHVKVEPEKYDRSDFDARAAAAGRAAGERIPLHQGMDNAPNPAPLER